VVEEEEWDKEEADKDRASADHHLAYAQNADTQLHTVAEHHALA